MQYAHLIKANQIFLFVLALLVLLYLGESFFVPFIFAVFISALMEPVANRLQSGGLGNVGASLVSTFIVFLIAGGLAYLLFYQLSLFAADFPEIRGRLQDFYRSLQHLLYRNTGFSPQEQQEIINNRSGRVLDAVDRQLTAILENVLTAAVQFFLILIVVFLLLLNRDRYYNVLFMFIKDEKKADGHKILNDTKKVAHHYLWGRLQVMTLLAIMYIITFSIFDVRYALLLTLFGALITIIPYIGPFISGLLPILIVVAFGRDVSEILIFTSVIIVIQLIESYVLEPLILGSEVRLSPLAVIVAIIIGGMTWGVAGMILFVPIFAILKIIASHTPELEPIAYLLDSNKGSNEKKFTERVADIFRRK